MTYKFTNQEAFDKVVKHLVKQGKPAVVNGNCQYQTEDGMKCAAGCLVERKATRENLEGDWCDVIASKPHLKNLANPNLVTRLQEAHDDRTCFSLYEWRNHWVASMRKIAKNYKVKTTLLTKLATKEWLNLNEA